MSLGHSSKAMKAFTIVNHTVTMSDGKVSGVCGPFGAKRLETISQYFYGTIVTSGSEKAHVTKERAS